MPNLTGQSIGRYHILEQLGEGGMATVYKAYDTRLERNVALKVLRIDQFIPAQLQMVLQRFEREAKSLAKLKHPNIVNILDFGEYENNPYLVMEYLPGGTLKQKLGQAIPWQEAFHLLIPVAHGLAYAHQHNIIHRDVKPANVLIDENQAPILTDFGIAKLLEGTEGHTLTGSGVGIGTPEYMAPEQGIGASTINARADIYSLGIVLYETITGRKPYLAETPMAVVLKQMNDPLPRPTDFAPDLPEGVEYILFKALAKEPEDRYADMDAMIAAMEGLLAEAPKAEAQAAPAPSKQVEEKVTPRAKVSEKADMTVSKRLAKATGRNRYKIRMWWWLLTAGVLALALLGVFFGPQAWTAISTSVETTSTSEIKVTEPVSTVAIIPTPTHEPRIINPDLYEYVNQEMTWHEARDYCDSRRGHLVTIQDADENEFVNQLAGEVRLWLGASDEAEEGTWVWITGEPWIYEKWAASQPDDYSGNDPNGEDYLSMGSIGSDRSRWNDASEENAPFVCEWETMAARDIAMALDFIQNQAPAYQTSFDTWDFGEPVENVGIAAGKLFVTSENQQYVGIDISNIISDRFAVEFDMRILDASPEGHCGFGANTGDTDDRTRRAITTILNSQGIFDLGHWVYPDGHLDIDGASSSIDTSTSNTALLIFIGDQVVTFINGQLAFTAHDDLGSAVYEYQALSANYTVECQYDNYKIWDLSGVNFPGAGIAPALESDIQLALALIQRQEPDFKTSFDSWDFGKPVENANVENGKLIVSNDQDINTYLDLNQLKFSSNRFAVEYELQLSGSRQDATCSLNIGDNRHNFRVISWPRGYIHVDHAELPGGDLIIGSGTFDPSKSNIVSLIVLNDQFSLFVNGQLAFTAPDPEGNVVYKDGLFEASSLITCEFDNFKFWDFSKMDLFH